MRSGKALLSIDAHDLQGPGLVLVTGPSGAGKSSFLKSLTGTLQDFQGGNVSGTVTLTGRDAKPAKVGFVTQDARDTFLAHDPQTEFQLRLQARGWRQGPARHEAQELLARLGLHHRARVPLDQLSAGERRRLALFASRIRAPDVLLLDEPLNHLDAEWRTTIVNDISAFADHALVIVATHETAPWEAMASARIHIEAGRIVAPPASSFSPPASPDLPEHGSGAPLRLVAADVTDARSLFAPVSLQLTDGLHAIAGPNGSGKSTLLRILGGIERPATGTILLDQHDIHALAPSRQAALRVHHIEEPRDTFFVEHARDEIRFQPKNAGASRDDIDARVDRATNAFRLTALADRHPLALSGGEQERLALACTQAARGQLILLDEPTQGLDAQGRRDLVDFLAHAARTACVIVATHDEEILQHATTLHRFEEGRLIERRGPKARSIVEVRPRAH